MVGINGDYREIVDQPCKYFVFLENCLFFRTGILFFADNVYRGTWKTLGAKFIRMKQFLINPDEETGGKHFLTKKIIRMPD